MINENREQKEGHLRQEEKPWLTFGEAEPEIVCSVPELSSRARTGEHLQ